MFLILEHSAPMVSQKHLDFKNQFLIICTWLVLRNAHLRTSNESCLPSPESNKTLEQNRAGVCICIYWWGTAIPADGQFRPVGGVVSTDNPITVRSQSDLQSDHSPITVRSYVLLPFHITRLKRIYRFERWSFFFLWTSQVAGKIYDRTVIGLWSDCRSDCDRTVVGLLHGVHARASSL